MKLIVKIKKPRNLIVMDLCSAKYRMRVVPNKKKYNRKTDNKITTKEMSYG